MRRFHSRYASGWYCHLAALIFLLMSALAAFGQTSMTTIRDIYGTHPSSTDFYQAGVTHTTSGSQAIRLSTAPVYSPPYSLRLKFAAGNTRNEIGIRLMNTAGAPQVLDLASVRSTAGLHFYLNPKAAPSAPSFSVGLVCLVGGVEVETRVALSNYLTPANYANAWTEIVVPFSHLSNTGFYYNSTGQMVSSAFSWSTVRGLNFSCDTTVSGFYDPSVDNLRMVDISTSMPALQIQGQRFVTSQGQPVRFWGVNFAAVYPTHQQADALAKNLAGRQVNLVRWHHLLRKSLDWNTTSKIPALVDYVSNTRTPHPEAWDRFDYMNARLAEKGIYTSLSLDSSRRYLAGDVDILTTTSQDRANWIAAINALNSMPSNIDLVRILPMIDARAAALMEEHIATLLTHVNPYTGKTYAQDPQVLYLEVMNETSSEYAIVAGNRFTSTSYPAVSYWDTVIQGLWASYTSSNGVAPCNLYTPQTNPQRLARGEFLRGLDQAYFNRIKAFTTGLGLSKPLTFSNLWRGESFQNFHANTADIIEDHQYKDPFVVRSLDDVIKYTTRSAIAGKPYFVGELNQQEGAANLVTNGPYRNMLQLAAAVYGGLQDWSGISWFAWQHGDFLLGDDGWSVWEERHPTNDADMIGRMMTDGMLLDHYRTAGMIFRQGLASPGVSPKVLYVDSPHGALSYSSLIQPKYEISAGWQSIHQIRRAYGTVPAGQASAPWMSTTPANPQVSDTGQISKDTVRKQLAFAVPSAEAFSGLLDAQPPAKLSKLKLANHTGMATVIAVSASGAALGTTNDIVVSRTAVNAQGNDVDGPRVTLSGLAPATGGQVWHMQLTRPRGEAGYTPLPLDAAGNLVLPLSGWNECELKRAPAGSLPPPQSTYAAGDSMLPIFDDNYVLCAYNLGLTLNAQSVIDPAGAIQPPDGTHYLRLKFTNGFATSQLGLTFVNTIWQPRPLDLTGSESSLALKFWIYTKVNVPSLQLSIFSIRNGIQLKSSVALSNYLTAGNYGNHWVEVTVPLTDFPANGQGTDANGQPVTQPLAWDTISGIAFSCNTLQSGYYDPNLDNLRLVYH